VGVYLLGVYFVGVYLTGAYLTGVHLVGVYLVGVYPWATTFGPSVRGRNEQAGGQALGSYTKWLSTENDP
jgi:hypothetical protein